MKTNKNTKIIGIDHGYGNMKTANHCFKTGISAYESEPLFTADMLTYNGKYYLIGEGHKEFAPDKVKDEDYYVLTLAAIAKELKAENLTEAHVVLAAGLPLTWTSGQKAEFKAYLSKNAEVEFVYKKTTYHIYIDDVRIYPQGYAAIASFATTLKGVNLIADIGNGTMNVLYMINGKPQQGKMFTEKFGTYQCTLSIREAFMNLWLISYPTLPMRTVNTTKDYSIRKHPIFSAHRRMKKSCPILERGKHSLKRQ